MKNITISNSLINTQKHPFYLNFIQILDKLKVLFGQLRSVIRIISSSWQNCFFMRIYLPLIVNYILTQLFILQRKQSKNESILKGWKQSCFSSKLTQRPKAVKPSKLLQSAFKNLKRLTFLFICFFFWLKRREQKQENKAWKILESASALYKTK